MSIIVPGEALSAHMAVGAGGRRGALTTPPSASGPGFPGATRSAGCLVPDPHGDGDRHGARPSRVQALQATMAVPRTALLAAWCCAAMVAVDGFGAIQ